MESGKETSLLRIYLSSTDKFRHSPLYEVIVFAAHRSGMARAVVFRGVMGFGPGGVIHNQKFWEVEESIPMVVEIMDEYAKIREFTEMIMPYFHKTRDGCTITMEQVKVLLHDKEKDR